MRECMRVCRLYAQRARAADVSVRGCCRLLELVEELASWLEKGAATSAGSRGAEDTQ